MLYHRLVFGDFSQTQKDPKLKAGVSKAAFELISLLEGRWVDGAHHVAMQEGLAMLPEKKLKSYKGLPEHTDNNIIKGAPEVQE